MVEMTFWDHLEELRRVIFRCLGVLIAVMIAFFIWMPDIFDSVIMAPCFGTFLSYEWFCSVGQIFSIPNAFCDKAFEINIINIQLTSQFMIHIRTALLMAVIVVFPYILYEIWLFVRPALYDNEKKGMRFSFASGSLLFYAGIAVSYFFVFPLTLRFLAGYQISSHVVNQLSLDSYINTFFSLNLIMGVVFEMPMLALILSKLGLINKSFFRKYRRHAIVFLFILAAVITPTGDPFTLTIVALPLYLLYELSGLIVRDEKEESEEIDAPHQS